AHAEGFIGLHGTPLPSELRAQGPLTLRLWRPCYLEGDVRDLAGRPVSGVQLSARPEDGSDVGTLPALPRGWEYGWSAGFSAVSDERGHYRSAARPGLRSLRVHVESPIADCPTQVGPLGDSGTTTTCDLLLTPVPLGAIEGHARCNDLW